MRLSDLGIFVFFFFTFYKQRHRSVQPYVSVYLIALGNVKFRLLFYISVFLYLTKSELRSNIRYVYWCKQGLQSLMGAMGRCVWCYYTWTISGIWLREAEVGGVPWVGEGDGGPARCFFSELSALSSFSGALANSCHISLSCRVWSSLITELSLQLLLMASDRNDQTFPHN